MTEFRSIETVLAEWRDGNECGWDEEFEWLEQNHADKLETLMADIEANGIREPILLGNDGCVWDGHHRLYCAHILGIRMVPTELAGA